MTEMEEGLIYDAMIAIQNHSKAIVNFINDHPDIMGAKECREAYKEGVYAPCIKLQCLLSEEAMERGKQRHAKIEKECKEYFEKRRQEQKEQKVEIPA